MDKLLCVVIFCFGCLHINASDHLLDELLMPVVHNSQNFAREAAICTNTVEHSDLPLHSKSLLEIFIRLVANGYQPLTGETFEQSVKRIYKLRVSQGKNTSFVNESLPLVEYVKAINNIANAASKQLENYMKVHNQVSAGVFEVNSDDANDGSFCSCICLYFKSKI